MKQGQTSVRGGVQDLLCPFTRLYISQGSNGQYSHQGSTAIDVINGKDDTTKAPYYAPCDVKVVNVDHKHAFVWWQSVKPVRLANGSISNVTVLTGHDNVINAKIDQVVKQGVQIGNMGTGGTATGVHAHIEVSPTLETTWIPNKHGVYILPNQIEFEEAFFMDNTEILLGVANWKYLKDVNVVEETSKAGKFTFGKLDHSVRVREGKNGLAGKDTGYKYESGMSVNLDGTYQKDGYTFGTYIADKTGTRRSVAIAKGNKEWGTFEEVKPTPTPKPKPNPKPKQKKIVIEGFVESWSIHKAGQAPTDNNVVAYIYPKRFGGLTYDIIAEPYTNVVTIKTRDYGEVNLPLSNIPNNWYKIG